MKIETYIDEQNRRTYSLAQILDNPGMYICTNSQSDWNAHLHEESIFLTRNNEAMVISKEDGIYVFLGNTEKGDADFWNDEALFQDWHGEITLTIKN